MLRQKTEIAKTVNRRTTYYNAMYRRT